MALISLVRTLDTTYLHIGIILSTLGLSPYGFALGLYPKRPHTNGDIVYPYIPMIFPTSSQCETLVVYPTILLSIKRPPNFPSNDHIHPLSTNQDSPLQCIGSTRLTWNTTCLKSLLYPDQLLFTVLGLGHVYEEYGVHRVSK